MFIGRDYELNELQRFLKKRTATLIVCRGRRRIGKSALVEQFGLKAKSFIQIQGIPPRKDLSNQKQLDSFSEQLAAQTNLPKLKLESWPQAFQLLSTAIEKEPSVRLLDEISWMG